MSETEAIQRAVESAAARTDTIFAAAPVVAQPAARHRCGHSADPKTWLDGGPAWQCPSCFPDVFPMGRRDVDEMTRDELEREVEQLRDVVATYHTSDAAVMAAARWRREAERLAPLARIGVALMACERTGGVVYWPAGRERIYAAYDLYNRLAGLETAAVPTPAPVRTNEVPPSPMAPAHRTERQMAMAG